PRHWHHRQRVGDAEREHGAVVHEHSLARLLKSIDRTGYVHAVVEPEVQTATERRPVGFPEDRSEALPGCKRHVAHLTEPTDTHPGWSRLHGPPARRWRRLQRSACRRLGALGGALPTPTNRWGGGTGDQGNLRHGNQSHFTVPA